MRFRTRLIVALAGIGLVTNGALLAITYTRFRAMELDAIRSHVLSIAGTTATFLDADRHRTIQTREDESSPAYLELRDTMRRARDANRRDDLYVRYLYTLVNSSKQPGAVEFRIDAEEDPEQVSHVGDILEYEGEPIVIGAEHANSRFTKDKWGEWMSAIVPLKDRSGQVVAGLGVDVDARQVTRRLDSILLDGLEALAVSIALALGAALFLARRVSRPLYEVHRTLKMIQRGDFDARLQLDTRDEFEDLARSLNEMAAALKERDALKSAFARYVSHQVMDTILSSGDRPSLSGARTRITVMFTDIRGFTRMAEPLPPEEVVKLLNEYFARMISVVFAHRGTLDKFIGDGLMVIFGAPVEDPDHARNAVRAALEMQRALVDLRAQWTGSGKAEVRIGIGIHTGEAVVGNIGSEERMEYTAIGDTVNLASRLESATKELGVDILVSQSTLEELGDEFRVTSRGAIQVKGRAAAVETWSVEGMARGEGLRLGSGGAG